MKPIVSLAAAVTAALVSLSSAFGNGVQEVIVIHPDTTTETFTGPLAIEDALADPDTVAGSVLEIGHGAFSAPTSIIDRYLVIRGTGSGEDSGSNTHVVVPSTGDGFVVDTSGAGDLQPLVIGNLRLVCPFPEDAMGIDIYDGSNILVEDVAFEGMSVGICFYYGATSLNISIESCLFYNVGLGVRLFDANPAPGEIGIRNSIFYNVQVALATETALTYALGENNSLGGVPNPIPFLNEISSQRPLPVNDALPPFNPEATPSLVIPAGTLTTNDFNPAGGVLTVLPAAGPAYGTLDYDPDAGSFLYTPAPGFAGTDSFTYNLFNGATFSMSAATVTVAVEGLYPAQGSATYTGILTPPALVVDANNAGLLTFTTSAPKNSARAFTGKLAFEGKTYGFKGQFDSAVAPPFVAFGVPIRAGTPAVEPIVGNFTWTTDAATGADIVIAEIAVGLDVYFFEAGRQMYAAKDLPVPQAGAYTMAFRPDDAPAFLDPNFYPPGFGHAIVTISASGLARASGKLGDGTPVTNSSYVSQSAEWPFYVSLYSKKGFVAGTLVFQDAPGYSDLGGNLAWMKPSLPKDKFYPAGFATVPAAQASRYAKPVAPAQILTFFNSSINGSIFLTDGNLSSPVVESLRVAKNLVTVVGANPNNVRVKFDTGKGTLSGSVVDAGKTYSLNGIVLQKSNTAVGFFLGNAKAVLPEVPQVGSMFLLPNE